MTLHQLSNAFIAAKGNRTFHGKNCPKVSGLQYLTGFMKYSEAIAAGYVPCRNCHPSEKLEEPLSIPLWSRPRPNETKEGALTLLTDRGYAGHIEAADLIVETEVGRWAIHTDTSPVTLSHINKVVTPEPDPPFHTQPRLFLSMQDAVLYITRHDDVLARRTTKHRGQALSEQKTHDCQAQKMPRRNLRSKSCGCDINV